ncbi:MAG: hypothetical protein WD187_03795 [Candidatus Woykebacteria bacterium]
MAELMVRTCPKCEKKRLPRGRAVTQDVDGASQEVCDVCALPSVKDKVRDRGERIRKQMIQLSFLDLSRHQRELEDAELYVEEAEEKLPDKWKNVAGNLLMAQRIIYRVERQLTEDIARNLLILVEENLAKSGKIESANPDETAKEQEQKKLDVLRDQIELNARVARESLADYENKDLPLRPQDRRKLLRDARRQAARAYFKSLNYLERKTEVDVDKLVETIIGSADEDEEAETSVNGSSTSTPADEERVREDAEAEVVLEETAEEGEE